MCRCNLKWITKLLQIVLIHTEMWIKYLSDSKWVESRKFVESDMVSILSAGGQNGPRRVDGQRMDAAMEIRRPALFAAPQQRQVEHLPLEGVVHGQLAHRETIESIGTRDVAFFFRVSPLPFQLPFWSGFYRVVNLD